MLVIRRLKIKIYTEKGIYGFDQCFYTGLNIIASESNTSGKSSIINGLYYGLGFEQLIEGSGIGSKTLSQAFTKQIRIDDDEHGKELPVIESEVQVELSNGKDVITARRFAKHEKRKDNLITVYYSNIENMYSASTKCSDMYVNMPFAARHELGFHKFLAEFLEMDLPEVPMTNGADGMLYIQAIFGALFIEQKHGWAGFLNGVPYLGIAEVKKRIVEYLLALSSLANERARKLQKRNEESLVLEWRNLCSNFKEISSDQQITIENLPDSPILSREDLNAIKLTKNKLAISDYLLNLKKQVKDLESVEPQITTENRERIETALKKVQQDIIEKQLELDKAQQLEYTARINLNKTRKSLEIIQTDILNNKDAKRLRDLGSQQGIENFDHICPTCGQEINDSLLRDKTVMSIDENLAHLQNQEKLFLYTEQAQSKALKELRTSIERISASINDLRKLESVLQGDLVKVKNDYSFANAYQKAKMDIEIDSISKVIEKSEEIGQKLATLSDKWCKCMAEKERLGKKVLDETDSYKLNILGNEFANLLKEFGYKSTQHFENIKISEDTFLPTINGFDMRYDSSASDELRNIWAFTLALLNVSITNGGNHPRILIYDEPKQQSVVDESFKKLCEKLINHTDTQIIIGVTASDNGVKAVLSELEQEKITMINIGVRAFKLLDQ